MKKLMTMLLATVMVLSTMSMLAITTSAEVEGDWVTSRAADAYQEGKTDYTPAAGYKYEVGGFQTVSPDFTNCAPYVQAHTRKAYDLKAPNADGNGNAISVNFTVTEYAYNGGDPAVDQWIAITLNSQPIVKQGATEYGSGLCILIRGGGGGTATALPHYTDGANGKFSHFATHMINPTVNDDGKEEYTFSIKHDGTKYVMNLCGVEMTDPQGALDAILDEQCSEGVYVGISLMTNIIETPASFLITKFQGEEVFGEDSADPEVNMKNFAEIAPSDSVPAGQPAVKWDGKTEQCDELSIAGADYVVQESGVVTLKNYNTESYIQFQLKNEISYQAADFPYIALLTRNCWADEGKLYYMADKNFGANANYLEDIYLDEFNFGEGWSLAIVDLSYYNEDGWTGRMNALRVDFKGVDIEDEDFSTFDVAYFAAFRSVEDAQQYAKDYLIALLGALPETTEKPTEAPTTEADTEADPDDETEGKTEGKTDAKTEGTTAAEQSSGCGAIVAAPVVALVAILGVAFVAKKKD